jgi:hypothetical protein
MPDTFPYTLEQTVWIRQLCTFPEQQVHMRGIGRDQADDVCHFETKTIATTRVRFSDNETGAQFIFDNLEQANEAYNTHIHSLYQQLSAQYYGMPIEFYHIDNVFRHYPDPVLYQVPIDENTHGLPGAYEQVGLAWLNSYDRLKASLPSPKNG